MEFLNGASEIGAWDWHYTHYSLDYQGHRTKAERTFVLKLGLGLQGVLGTIGKRQKGEGTLAYTGVVLIRNDELMIGLHWNGSKCCTILGLGLWHCVIIRTVFACQYC